MANDQVYGATLTGASSIAYQGPKSNAPRDIGALPLVVMESEKLLHSLNEELSQLEQRIGGVLRPSNPTPANASSNGNALSPSMSSLTSDVYNLRNMITTTIDRVRELNARADL